MKNRTSLFALSFSAGLLALSLNGCSSFPRHSSTHDASNPIGGKAINLLQLRDSVKSTRLALNRTTDALNRVATTPDAQDSYGAFATELDAFQKFSKKTLLDSADVRNSGNTLFAKWDEEAKSINDAEIRAIAEQRRTTLQMSYNAMITPLLAARADLTDVTSVLSDIRKALALDLTPAGIAAVKKPIASVNSKAVATSASLDKLAADLDRIAAALPAPTVAPVK
ncbi:MAG: DUF2959 family protein [Opitutaceae bacterium]|jgi:hypothetical protein